MIRIPVYMNEELLKCKKVTEALTHKLKRKPTVNEVAKRMQTSVQKVREAGQWVTKMSSLEAPIGEDGEGQVKDLIEDDNLIAPDAALEGFFDKERTTGFLEMMTPRERQILELRFGIIDGNQHTLAQIAKKMGVSRERIRQVESAALKKIRRFIKRQGRTKQIEE